MTMNATSGNYYLIFNRGFYCELNPAAGIDRHFTSNIRMATSFTSYRKAELKAAELQHAATKLRIKEYFAILAPAITSSLGDNHDNN